MKTSFGAQGYERLCESDSELSGMWCNNVSDHLPDKHEMLRIRISSFELPLGRMGCARHDLGSENSQKLVHVGRHEKDDRFISPLRTSDGTRFLELWVRFEFLWLMTCSDRGGSVSHCPWAGAKKAQIKLTCIY